MKKLWLCLIGSFFLISCNGINSEKNDAELKTKKAETGKVYPSTNSDADILNNIIVQEKGGIKLSRAFLAFEDGTLVPKGNKVSLGEAVYLHLSIKKGWKVKDGKVSIDASEKIETDAGEPVVNVPNLFKTMSSVDEDRANAIQLKARITKTRPGIGYYLVSFRVWDKHGNAEITGSYKLYISSETGK